MTIKSACLAAAVAASLTACANGDLSSLNSNALMASGGQAYKAMSLSASDVKQLSDQACQQEDKTHTVAAANSKYQQRLNRIASQLGNDINGQPVNYKVYMTKDVNAWAMANGCVRVYSGLMDMMNDDEVRGVVGHEMGHVALGHTQRAMQVAYATTAARGLAGASGNSVVASLSNSQLGALAEALVNAQFSQSQETAADDYSFDAQKKKGQNPRGLVTAFQKLAKLDNGQSSMFSSHPSSPDRAQHIEQRIANGQ
ncbi:metalloprotease LoiP [Chitinasiproducens palmae]|uniref:Putative metalloprotease n=1 Tax=Chitinasiproducens palmae TaxID=1770053 RepID=A0A1H2PS15_9BURK|nr:M48 family metalloprotease [Chitinasiproducens palmae]SDV49314.1 putative metalloprotease [Chitinasiproducens palmae]